MSYGRCYMSDDKPDYHLLLESNLYLHSNFVRDNVYFSVIFIFDFDQVFSNWK